MQKPSLRASISKTFRMKTYSNEALVRVMLDNNYKDSTEVIMAGVRLLPNFTQYEAEAKEAYVNSINKRNRPVDIFVHSVSKDPTINNA